MKIARKDHDEYCFTCHKLGQELVCVSCPRSFHKKCLSSSKVFDESGDCYLCRQVKSTREEFSNWPFHKLSLLMMDVVRFAFPMHQNDKEVYVTWPSDKKVAYVADWDRIIDKCRDYDENHYYSPVEILADAMWLHHNCIITFGAHSVNSKRAKKILADVQLELNDFFACRQCYGSKGNANSFTNICKPPHCIVWVKVKGFPYWPAKVLKVDNGHAHVKFFKTYQSSFRVKDVLWITKKFPPKGQIPPQQLLISAIEELGEYVKRFERKYGSESFPYKSDFQPYDFEKGKEEMLKIHEKVFQPVKDPKVLERRRQLKKKYSCRISNAILIDLTGISETVTVSENSHLENSVTINGRLLPGNIDDQSLPIVSETTSLVTPNIVVQSVRSVPEPSVSADFTSEEVNQPDNDFGASSDFPVSSSDADSFLESVDYQPMFVSSEDVINLSDSETKKRKMNDTALAMIAEADPLSKIMVHKGLDVLKDLLVQFWVQGASTEKNLGGTLRSQRLLGVNAEISLLRRENKKLSTQLADTKKNADYLFKYLKNNVYMAQVAKIMDLQNNICALTEKYNQCLAQLKAKNEVEYKSTEAQTDIDYEAMNSMNGNYEEAINTAKFYAYCTVCFRPATITCCFNNSWHTDYCSKLCQDKHREEHLSVCERVKKKEKTNCTHCSTQKTYENKTVSSTFEQKVVIEQVVSSFTPHLDKDEISENPESNILACSSQTVSIAAQKTVSEESEDITQK